MREKTKRDLRKLFKLLKARRPLWDKDDKNFYHEKTVSDLWFEVFQEMNRKDSEVKSLLLQLRKLLRVKKPKRVSQLKAYFNKSSSDWRNVTYLKGVENLHSIPSLDIDEDSDSTCTVSTMTTDIDGDTNSDSGSAVGDPAVGDPAVGDPAVSVPTTGDTTVIDMAFGDMNLGDTAAGDGAFGYVPIDGPAEVDPSDNVSTVGFWGDGEWTNGESADDDWPGDESSELCWSSSGTDCYDRNEEADNDSYQESLNMKVAPYALPMDSDEDFLLYYVHPRLAMLDSSVRMTARVEILRALQKFEKPRRK